MPIIRENMEPPIVDTEDDPEVKLSATTCSTDVEKDVIRNFIERYFSWTKLKRATAWLLRYRDYLPVLAKTKKREPIHTQKDLNVKKVKNAERVIVRYAQGQEYAEEMQNLQNPMILLKDHHVSALLTKHYP